MIDTHAHLTDEHYNDTRDFMIKNFKTDGLDYVFTIGYDFKSSVYCVRLAEKYDNVYAIIGVHPEEIASFTSDCREYFKLTAKHPKVLAIGEIGLDYHYRQDNKDEQKKVFIEQLKLASEEGLPVVIHNRDSIGDCLEILKENKDYLCFGGVVHCFSESAEIYKEIKKLGLKISFGGTLTFKNSHVAPKVCEIADLEDILIETDCPYLTPHPFRGQVNEPKYTTYVAQKISEIKGISYDRVVETTTNNALNLFKKANK